MLNYLLTKFLRSNLKLKNEASRLGTKMRHFDVQLVGGIVLHQGKIAEMATGEAKTLLLRCLHYLNALTGKMRSHCHSERLPRATRLHRNAFTDRKTCSFGHCFGNIDRSNTKP